MRLASVLRAMQAHVWAILPEHLSQMIEALHAATHGGEVDLAAFREQIAARGPVSVERQGGVAVIPIHGSISYRSDLFTELFGGTSVQTIKGMLDGAMASPDVGSIVLDIDSPGGTVDGVPELAAHLYSLRGRKPITAVANTLAASAAYYIGSAAEEFVVAPSGMAGSIGVVSAHMDVSKALEEMGVKVTLIAAGKYKTEGSPYEPLSDDARDGIQQRVDDAYDQFVKAVAKHRRASADDVRNGYGEGRVLSARRSVRAGLADREGTLEQVVAGYAGTSAGKRKMAAATITSASSADIEFSLRLDTSDFDTKIAAAIAAVDRLDSLADSACVGGAAVEAPHTAQGDSPTIPAQPAPVEGHKGDLAMSDRDTAANANGAAPAGPSRERQLAELVELHPQFAGKLAGWQMGDTSVTDARAEIKAALQATAPQGIKPTAPSGGVAVPRLADKPFASPAEQLEAVVRHGRGESLHPRLGYINTSAYKLDAAVSGMSEGVGPDGGFFIEPQLAPGLIEPIYDEDPFLSRVQRLTLSTNATSIRLNLVDETSRATGSRWGGVRAYWAGEADTATASKPKLRALQVDVNKLMAIAYQTEELANDAPAMAQLAARAFPAEMRYVLTEAVWRGTGAGQPKGWLASGAQYEQAIEATQTIANTNTFLALNLSKMRMRLPAGLLGDSVYLYQPELLPSFITATVSSSTVPVWMTAMNLANAPQEMLLGRPAIPSEFAEAVGTVGDLTLVAPSQYLVVEKGGINYATSLHVRFLNDEQTFRWTYRVGGAPLWHTPHTPFKGTATSKSPFVTLGARS